MLTILRIILLNITIIIILFQKSAGYCADLQNSTNLFAAQDSSAWGQRTESKENQSFFVKAISGKYNLLEDDLSDIPHRPTRFDYIKEAMEDLRPYSRPAGDEFAILNLQWKEGSVFLNDLETASGTLKKQRGLSSRGKSKFFYRLFSDKNNTVHEDSFEIPHKLHYDFLDEQTGRLSGGAMEPSDLDFVIKIPLSDKSAQKIIFYQQIDRDWIKVRKEIYAEDDDLEKKETIIGEALF